MDMTDTPTETESSGDAQPSQAETPRPGPRRGWVRGLRSGLALVANAIMPCVRGSRAIPEDNMTENVTEVGTAQPSTPLGVAEDSLMKGDPRLIYEETEHRMRLSRLEEPCNLISALRQLVRKQHAEGSRVLFPVPEACDRIRLRSVGLPTDPEDLWQLTQLAFTRRHETLDLDEVYGDFVKVHGTVVFNPRENWPHCYSVTHFKS